MGHYWTGLGLVCAMFAADSNMAFAQMTSLKPEITQPDIEAELLASIGLAEPKYTPLIPKTSINSLPVKVLYDGPTLEGDFQLEITLLRPDKTGKTRLPRPITTTTIYLTKLGADIDVLLNLTEDADGLLLEASVRDSNRNLIAETPFPLPVISKEARIIRLVAPSLPEFTDPGMPDFTAGLWERRNTPDMSLKAWITDRAGRKIFVMNSPTGYNGADIDYAIRLEGLRQGKNTKRGANLSTELMAQTLIVQAQPYRDPLACGKTP